MGNEGAKLFDETLKARRRLQKSAFLALGVVVALRLAAEISPLLRRPDLLLLDSWQSLRGTDKPSGQVVIVGIDEKSIANPKFGPPPWPRSQYVPLIERLTEAGARVIGFDYTFGSLEREAENNDLLSRAMAKAGNVVFGIEFTELGNPSPPKAFPSDAVRANALSRVESVAVPPAAGLIEPEDVLARSAAALGHVTTVTSEDGRIRTLPLVVRYGDRAYPSLALQVARLYTKSGIGDLSLSGGLLTLGTWRIPVTPSGEVLVNWPAAGEAAFVQYSFLDVVRGDVPKDAFRGKAVLVAGTAKGLDDRAFPFKDSAPGVLLHAAFLDNVFRADFVQAPLWAWIVEWALFLVSCAIGGWMLPRLSTRQLLLGVSAAVLLFLGVSAFLYVQEGIWLRSFYPAVALLVPLGAIVPRRLTESEREARDLTAENLEKEKLLGLSFQEKGMLDMALATFNKLPLTEDMKHVLVNLGLDYEHRGQAQRALNVYKKVFERDPSFEGLAERMARLGQPGGATPGLAQTFPAAAVAPTLAVPPTQRVASAVTLEGSEETTGIMPRRPGQPEVSTIDGTSTILPGGRFGRYEIERHLGRGGMGDVYAVKDVVLNRKAALKTVRLDTNLSPKEVIEVRQRFYVEAQTAGRLAHPNIVTIYDVGEEQGMSYIVMELIDGHSLATLMKKDRLSVEQSKHVIGNAGVGLDHAHQNGVFHRDVKPDNIMISKTGLVKLMDFGIARLVESELTKTGNLIGTPAYMSPEQVHGQKVDARSDIFSLGVILYELLTGQKPFAGNTIPSIMFAIIEREPPKPSLIDASLKPAWDEVLQRALAKKREERFATAAEFVEAVRQIPA
jgi:serine/threonine-protein kinase